MMLISILALMGRGVCKLFKELDYPNQPEVCTHKYQDGTSAFEARWDADVCVGCGSYDND